MELCDTRSPSYKVRRSDLRWSLYIDADSSIVFATQSFLEDHYDCESQPPNTQILRLQHFFPEQSAILKGYLHNCVLEENQEPSLRISVVTKYLHNVTKLCHETSWGVKMVSIEVADLSVTVLDTQS